MLPTEVLSGLQISQQLAQHNYQTEFLDVLMKYRCREVLSSPTLTAPPQVLSPSPFSTPSLLYSVIAAGWWRKSTKRLTGSLAAWLSV